MEKQILTINDFSLQMTSELYMTFNLSEKHYAIPAEKIVEIVQLPALQILEKLPDYIVGVMNLRGNIISVINLRKFMGITQKKFSIDDQVLIINVKGKHIGIIVDAVNDVLQFSKELLEPLPYKNHESFISGIYKNADSLVAFLDLDLILNNIEAVHAAYIRFEEDSFTYKNLFNSDPISQEKFKKRAINLQKEIKTETYKDNYYQNNFVSFSLNNEMYCLSLQFVREFCKLRTVSIVPVPCVPEFITGIFNLRGEFITIIDIKSFLQIEKTKITDKSKIIVIKTPKIQLGLLVDDVFNIVNIPKENLYNNTPSKFDKNNYTSVQIMLDNGGVMSILDFEKFIEDDRLFVEDAV